MQLSERRQRYRQVLAGNACVHPASVFDAMSARIAESLGFEVGMFAGSIASGTVLGAPDLVVLTLTEFKLFAHLEDALSTVPIPVAVIPFGWQRTRERLKRLGKPTLRENPDGTPYQTDDSNYILDLSTTEASTAHLATQLKGMTGVVEHGLFLDLATLVIAGTSSGVVTFSRSTGSKS
jgi:hypothetical protein